MSNYTLNMTRFYILLSLIESRHGYSIIENVQSLSDNHIQLAVGEVFSDLEYLHDQQFVEIIDTPTDSRRREYKITDSGLEFLQEQYTQLSHLLTISQSLLTSAHSTNDYEFY